MKPFVTNIEQDTLENNNFRKVLFTARYSQLVVMTLQPGEDIGKETHGFDQFIRIEQGIGKAILDGVEYDVEDDWAMVIPGGVEHNVVNSGEIAMKLYTVYSPPEHKDGTVHVTKEQGEADHDNDHFDGVVTEL